MNFNDCNRSVLSREERAPIYGLEINSIRQEVPICFDSIFGPFLNQRAVQVSCLNAIF